MMYRVYFLIILVLVMPCVVFSITDAGPQVNGVIWKKEVEDGGTLIVERAYVYGPVLRYYQYAFIHETKDGDTVSRRLLWLRNGYVETMSAKVSDPELTMLEGQISKKVLHIVFNQYERCWGFAIASPDVNNLGVAQPSHPDLQGNMNWATTAIAVSAQAKDAKILKPDDLAKSSIIVTNEKNEKKKYSLLEDAKQQWKWFELSVDKIN